ncbi:MAG TPA: thiamine pyrophosphate-dependent enzyme [Bryobacteraceae bacterium]|nr:thiamine pyrophosphate-dependent enzyme [Bryobacteraceae bacterium]
MQPLAQTAAGVLIDTLHRWNVEVIFGLPGDGINGIMEALRQRQDKVRFIQARHEESAALMACGYAKYTGKLGVCLATSGPGGIHLLNGLYDAKLDGAPVLAITGLQFHDLIGTYTQQDVALDKLFMDVAVFNERIMGPTHVENIAELACRTALAYRGVSHIAFPVDLQDKQVDWSQGSKRNIKHHVSYAQTLAMRAPAHNDLQLAADILNQGKKVAILAGQGAIGAASELELVAERLGAPIIKALLGKAAVPDDSPYTTGGIGLLGTAPSQDALEHCDTLLMVGTSFPYIEYLPKPKAAKAVQVDINSIRIGLRYPVDVGLVGDSRTTLALLLPLLEDKQNKRFLETAQRAMKAWKAILHTRSTVDEKPMKPQVVAAELNKRLAVDAIVSCDSGTVTTWWARYLSAQKEQKYSCSGTLATMACSVPYAIAAQIAYPERQCIAFIGDGAFTMLMGEFATCVKYSLPVKIFVIKNNYLGQIQWEQMVFLGNPEFGCDLHPIDFAAFAQACGGTGIRIDDPKNCGELIERAMRTPGPVLVEAVVDPFEPPMPGKVSASQAAKFAESLARGTPNRKKIALTVLSDKVREMV